MSDESKAIEQNGARAEAEQEAHRLAQVRIDKLKELQAEGRDPFQRTTYDVSAHSKEIKDAYGEYEGKEVSVAGRMMAKRIMGKASFCSVRDLQGDIQVYVSRDSLGEDAYKDFKRLDIGDLIGVRGTVFRTKTGETTIHATEVQLLSLIHI